VRTPEIRFIGVSTGGSLIHRAFPRWAAVLGLNATVRGVDLPRGSGPMEFRAAVRAIRDDRDCLGAVVTSWKSALFAAAAADFDALDSRALQCREINAVRHADGQLTGSARDPVSVGRVVDLIWPDREADLLCLGSGGTAIALARHLRERGQRGRMTFLDRDQDHAEHFTAVTGVPAEAHQGPYDAWVRELPPGGLVVNATGSGKDGDAEPVTSQVVYPRDSVFWDLNYRGDLRTLAVARSQRVARGVVAHDGLSLFCHGWAAALTAVLGLPEDPGLADAFAAALPAGVRIGEG
jgi:shikimate 5-dehydrogenase